MLLMSSSASDFGVRLRRFRLARGLTLQQVADAVGCTKAYIWDLEMKDGQRPSAERVLALAKVLGVTMGDIMGEQVPGVPDASPEDVAFFRSYMSLPERDRARARSLMDLLLPAEDPPGERLRPSD